MIGPMIGSWSTADRQRVTMAVPRLVATWTVLSAACLSNGHVAHAEDRVLVDEFDGAFDLDWHIVRPEPAGYSLESNPGELTLLTLRGSIWNSNERSTAAKNIFGLKESLAADQDFEAVLHISSFRPTGLYHQVGLILYESDAQYLKFTVEHRANKEPPTVLVVTNEMEGQAKNPGSVEEEIDGPCWLRLRRRRGLYQLDYSNDGEKFWMVADQEWTPTSDEATVRIGFLAKKGPSGSAPDIPAVIESFRLVLNDTTAKTDQ